MIASFAYHRDLKQSTPPTQLRGGAILPPNLREYIQLKCTTLLKKFRIIAFMHPEKPYHPDEVTIFHGRAKLQRILQVGDIKLTPPPHPQAESTEGTFLISNDGRALCFIPDDDTDTRYFLNLEENCTYVVDPRTQELRPSLLAIADIEVDPDTPDIACISSWICAWLKENDQPPHPSSPHYN